MLSARTNMIDKRKLLFTGPSSNSQQFNLLQGSFDLGKESEVEYIWTADPSLIKQYSRIIDEQFDAELNLRDVYKNINETDFRSYYRLFVSGNKVVGGFRMIVDDPLTEYSLPSERPGFTFKNTFKELDLLNNRYTELSRFAVDPQYRNNMNHYKDGFRAYKEKMTELGVKYLFLCSSRSRFRVYNRFAKDHFKLVDTKHLDVSGWEERYRHLEFYICAYDNEDV